jgi:transcription elongation factor Elf1
MTCPKCNSENVNVQAVSIMKNKKKGILYWLFIGIWFEPLMWFFLTIPMLIYKLFRPNKIKTQVKKMAICQECGKNWSI